ncbi:hypothetical protein [Nonomuraea sp. NPDC050786]|uniref:hypothetical protein n=1 Tax=Nonomuraea sp. NPDC050786 TaxID=3154840 RepID=UPI0033FB2AFD
MREPTRAQSLRTDHGFACSHSRSAAHPGISELKLSPGIPAGALATKCERSGLVPAEPAAAICDAATGGLEQTLNTLIEPALTGGRAAAAAHVTGEQNAAHSGEARHGREC